jgi:hypothetical protein
VHQLIRFSAAEKVYIVWENGVRRRLRSPVYLVCMGTVLLYVAVILAMFFGKGAVLFQSCIRSHFVISGRIAEFRSGDGACKKFRAAVSFAHSSYRRHRSKAYSLPPTSGVRPVRHPFILLMGPNQINLRYINVLLTSLFLWPLLRLKNVNPRLRRVATRTLV